jgi:hypothetical protein
MNAYRSLSFNSQCLVNLTPRSSPRLKGRPNGPPRVNSCQDGRIVAHADILDDLQTPPLLIDALPEFPYVSILYADYKGT